MGKMKKKKDLLFHRWQPHDMLHSLMFRELGYYAVQKKHTKELTSAAENTFMKKRFHTLKCNLPGYPKATFLMVFSPDGTKIASTHGNHNVYITELATGKNIKILTGHDRTPWCIAFHPSCSQILASGCLGGQVRVWDLNGGCEIWNAEMQIGIASLAFHPSKKLLVIATVNKIYFWDWSHSKPFAIASTRTFREKVRYVAFDNSGTKLITGISNIPSIMNPCDISLHRRILRKELLDGGSRLYRAEHGTSLWNILTQPLYNRQSALRRAVNNRRTLNESTPNGARNEAERSIVESTIDEIMHTLLREDCNDANGANSRRGENVRKKYRSQADTENDEEDGPSRRRGRSLVPPVSPVSNVNTAGVSNFWLSAIPFLHNSVRPDVYHSGPQRPVTVQSDNMSTESMRPQEIVNNNLAANLEDIQSTAENVVGDSLQRTTSAETPIRQSPHDGNIGDQWKREYRLLEEDSNFDCNTEDPSIRANSSKRIHLDSSSRNAELSSNTLSEPVRSTNALLQASSSNSSSDLPHSSTSNRCDEEEEHSFTESGIGRLRRRVSTLEDNSYELKQIRLAWLAMHNKTLRIQMEIMENADSNSNNSPEPSTSFHDTFSNVGTTNNESTSSMSDTFFMEYVKIRTNQINNDQNRPSTSSGITTTVESSQHNNDIHSKEVSTRCLHSLLLVLRDGGKLQVYVSKTIPKVVDSLCATCQRSRRTIQSTTSNATNDSIYSGVAANNGSDTSVTTNSQESVARGPSRSRRNMHTFENFRTEQIQLEEMMKVKLLSKCMERRSYNNVNRSVYTDRQAENMKDDDSIVTVDGSTELRARKALCVIGQSLLQFFKVNRSIDWSQRIDLLMHLYLLIQLACDLTTLLDEQTKEEVIKVDMILSNHLKNARRSSRSNNRSKSETEESSQTQETHRNSEENPVYPAYSLQRSIDVQRDIAALSMSWLSQRQNFRYGFSRRQELFIPPAESVSLPLIRCLLQPGPSSAPSEASGDTVVRIGSLLSSAYPSIIPWAIDDIDNTNPIFNPPKFLSCRVQAWDFSNGKIPDITDADENVIVKECKIRNDASISISADGKLLTTMFPLGTRTGLDTEIGVYSLDWNTLGKKICSTKIFGTVVSISLSPMQKHLIVGLARLNVHERYSMGYYSMARIYKLTRKDVDSDSDSDTTQEFENSENNWTEKHNTQSSTTSKLKSETKNKDMKIIPLRSVYPPDHDSTSFVSLNCIRWAPQPGQGFVYGTNTGELNILH